MVKSWTVPELYFDLIARVIPGAVILVGLLFVIPEYRDDMFSLQSPLIWILLILGVPASYAIGMVVSSISILVEFIAGESDDTIKRNLDQRTRPWHCRLNISEPVRLAIKEKIKDTFGVPYTELPVWLCLDHVRVTRPASCGSIVVKTMAEAAFMRAMVVVFLALGFAICWQNHTASGRAWAGILTAFAVICLFAFKAFRNNFTQRMLFSLLQPEETGLP